MLNKKHTEIIIGLLTAFALCLCLLAAVFSDYLTLSEQDGKAQEYETALFDTDNPLEINIEISESDWQKMLENATDEEYYNCDVEINGETFSNVGIRPKGNTSLTNIAADPDTDRYSFKLEFDKYSDGQSCYGLDKLVLNNNYADATNMKEAIVYDMYKFLDADASLYNYAAVYVNGEYWGVYLALEAVEESFLERNYGSLDGNLYKPEGMDMGNMGDIPNADDMPETPQQDTANNNQGNQENQSNGSMPKPSDFNQSNKATDKTKTDKEAEAVSSDENQTQSTESTAEPSKGANGNPPDFEGGNGGFGGAASGGADLNYTDDELETYSTIWDGSVTDSTKQDHKKVIVALKNISESNDIKDYLDVDNVLKYMAVHTFVVNLDSLSGNMPHNYYLYEEDGKLNIIPWDYNLSFGGMGGMSMGSNSDSASSTVNYAVDSPFSGTEFFDALLENEEYKAVYHSYLQELAEEYVNGGSFDATYNRIRSQIDDLVKTDPTAFYAYDEFTDAADMLYKTVKLRAESVLGQVNGTVPSTKEEQEAQTEKLIDSSEIDLAVMGQMNGGGGAFPGQDSEFDGEKSMQPAEANEKTDDEANAKADNAESIENTAEQFHEKNTKSIESDNKNLKEMPDNMSFSPKGGFGETTNNPWQGICEYIASFLILIAAIIFVRFRYRYRRKK